MFTEVLSKDIEFEDKKRATGRVKGASLTLRGPAVLSTVFRTKADTEEEDREEVRIVKGRMIFFPVNIHLILLEKKKRASRVDFSGFAIIA